ERATAIDAEQRAHVLCITLTGDLLAREHHIGGREADAFGVGHRHHCGVERVAGRADRTQFHWRFAAHHGPYLRGCVRRALADRLDHHVARTDWHVTATDKDGSRNLYALKFTQWRKLPD